MRRPAPLRHRPELAWALYDWANSAFATVVLAGFFPLFLRDYWAAGQPGARITLALGTANALASLLIVGLAPALGAIADQGAWKKRFLATGAALGIAATLALYCLSAGQWVAALGLFVTATVGWMAANIFYDALLLDVTAPARYERVSALGFALGYLGGGLLFAACVLLTLRPAWFGLADAPAAVRLSFLLTGLWWLAFSLPLLRHVRERRRHPPRPPWATARAGFTQLARTLRHLRGERAVWWFLLAYWLYIDGVDTVIRMAVDYGRALGFDSGGLVLALLLTQFVGFPAALAFGRLGAAWGARRGILLGLAAYGGITLWAARMAAAWEFYALAVAVGLVQGGVQALSRSLYARLIPADKAAEFFGFYNVLGKFAAILGPLLVGWVGLLAGSPRLGILSLLLLFGGGAWLLWRLPAAQSPSGGSDLR